MTTKKKREEEIKRTTRISQILQLLPPFCGGCAAQYWGRRRAICTVLPCKIARRSAIFPENFPRNFPKIFASRRPPLRRAAWARKKFEGQKICMQFCGAVRPQIARRSPQNWAAVLANLGACPRNAVATTVKFVIIKARALAEATGRAEWPLSIRLASFLREQRKPAVVLST
jgi:hypothetical protein